MGLKPILFVFGGCPKIIEQWELEIPKQENKRKSVLK